MALSFLSFLKAKKTYNSLQSPKKKASPPVSFTIERIILKHIKTQRALLSVLPIFVLIKHLLIKIRHGEICFKSQPQSRPQRNKSRIFIELN